MLFSPKNFFGLSSVAAGKNCGLGGERWMVGGRLSVVASLRGVSQAIKPTPSSSVAWVTSFPSNHLWCAVHIDQRARRVGLWVHESFDFCHYWSNPWTFDQYGSMNSGAESGVSGVLLVHQNPRSGGRFVTYYCCEWISGCVCLMQSSWPSPEMLKHNSELWRIRWP